jgi:hypothetical protein
MSVKYQQPTITDLTGALAPELHLRSADLESIVDDVMAYHAWFAPLFARLGAAGVGRGLLAPAARRRCAAQERGNHGTAPVGRRVRR